MLNNPAYAVDRGQLCGSSETMIPLRRPRLLPALQFSSAPKLMLHAILFLSTITIVRWSGQPLYVFYLPLLMALPFLLLVWYQQLPSYLFAQLLYFSVVVLFYNNLNYMILPSLVLLSVYVFLIRLFSRIVTPPSGPSLFYISYIYYNSSGDWGWHGMTVIIAVMFVLTSFKGKLNGPPALSAVAVLLMFVKDSQAPPFQPHGLLNAVVPVLCIATLYGSRVVVRHARLVTGSLFLSDLAIGFALMLILDKTVGLSRPEALLAASAYFATAFAFTASNAGESPVSTFSTALILLFLSIFNSSQMLLAWILPHPVPYLYLPLFKSLLIATTTLLGYHVANHLKAPLGLAVVQLVALCGIASNALFNESIGGSILAIDLSTIASFGLLAVSFYVCQRNFKAYHGRLWQLAFDDRTMVYFRKWFRLTKSGMMTMPIIGSIFGLIIIFLTIIEDQFEERRWTFGHVILILSFFVELVLFCLTVRHNIDAVPVGHQTLGIIIPSLKDHLQVDRAIELLSITMFGILIFLAAQLFAVTYLKELSLVLSTAAIIFLFVWDAAASTLVPWPLYIIAILFIGLGVHVVIHGRRPGST